jgi:NAD(P)-dependent dehydrogenase (short-subunit alcohol dehydrogenase family)
MGEAGPVWEIPIDLVRKNFEVNVFLPLVVTQAVVRRWVSEKRGKVVFTSSMGGLAHPPDRGIKNRRWPSGAPFRGSVVEAPLLMLVSAPAPTPVFLIASPRHCRVAAVPLSVRR